MIEVIIMSYAGFTIFVGFRRDHISKFVYGNLYDSVLIFNNLYDLVLIFNNSNSFYHLTLLYIRCDTHVLYDFIFFLKKVNTKF